MSKKLYFPDDMSPQKIKNDARKHFAATVKNHQTILEEIGKFDRRSTEIRTEEVDRKMLREMLEKWLKTNEIVNLSICCDPRDYIPIIDFGRFGKIPLDPSWRPPIGAERDMVVHQDESGQFFFMPARPEELPYAEYDLSGMDDGLNGPDHAPFGPEYNSVKILLKHLQDKNSEALQNTKTVLEGVFGPDAEWLIKRAEWLYSQSLPKGDTRNIKFPKPGKKSNLSPE